MNIEKNALHILVDMENVQLRLPELAGLQRGRHHLQIFHGPSQNKLTIELVRALQPLGDAVEYIQCEKAGPNALDFHLAFHLGRLIALRPEAHYLIISRDRGFEQLVAHANRMGHHVMQRAALPVNLADPAALSGPAVGTGRAARAGASTARTRSAAAPAPAAEATPVAAQARKAAAVKPAAKKAPARKAAAKKTDKVEKIEKIEKAGKPAAKKPVPAPAVTEPVAARKHAPAKKAAAKTPVAPAVPAAPAARKAPARKAAVKQAAVAAPAAAAPAANTRAMRDTANASDHHKAVAGLVKLGIKRPVTERALKHYLKSYLGNDLSDIAVQALVQHLVSSGELTLSQGKLSYHLSA